MPSACEKSLEIFLYRLDYIYGMMKFLIRSCSLDILINAFNMLASPSAIFAAIITFALYKVH